MNSTAAHRRNQFPTMNSSLHRTGRILVGIIPWLLAAALLASSALPVQAAPINEPSFSSRLTASQAGTKIAPNLRARLASQPAGEKLAVIVVLRGAIDPRQAAETGPGASRQERVIRSLQDNAALSQKGILQLLHGPQFAGKIGRINPFWIIDGISLQAAPEVIQALAAHPDVARIELEETIPAPTAATAATAAWDNLGRIGAPQMWALGYRGQGVVVASLDTGVDYTHPELQASWRGGTNSWYDPYGIHPTPVDLPSICGSTSSGHGTATMGVMVGSTVGVAPGASWIAAKIFDDNCMATTTAILDAFQWVLNPDGKNATADAPQVVNSSWGAPGCDTSLIFQPALTALRAAGILPVFSAGNYGPVAESSSFPANYPEAFAVGASDNADAVASFSSRGPNTCAAPPATFPALVAPGASIRTILPGSSYVTMSGTSFSAPHVAGALALLLSAKPGLSVQQQETILQSSAVDLGAAGPDNDYGYGRLDVQRAYGWLLNSATVGFAVTNLTAAETSGTLPITVTRAGGLAFPVSVNYAVSGGTAVAGVNYVPVSGTVSFAAGQAQQTIQVTVLQDYQIRPDLTLILGLSGPQIPGGNGVQTAAIDTTAFQMTLVIQNTDPWLLRLPFVHK